MGMKAIIIASGHFDPTPSMETELRQAPLVVAADGGARHLRKLGMLPHVIIGDLDSLPKADKAFYENAQVPFITYPSRKDQTDTDICIHHALEQGADEITFMGVTGTRLDHTLANIFLLFPLNQRGIRSRIRDRHNDIYLVSTEMKELVIQGSPGDYLSLVALSDTVEGIYLSGLEYPLENADLNRGSSLGVSNCFTGPQAKVSIRSGCLMVSRSRD